MKRLSLKNINELSRQEGWFPIEPATEYEGAWWRTLQDIEVELSDGRIIHIRKGYLTDISTGPQVLWSFLPPIGGHSFPAVIHDWLYTEKPFGKSIKEWLFADREMLRWSKVMNGNKPVGNMTRYILLTIGGWIVYFRFFIIKKKTK